MRSPSSLLKRVIVEGVTPEVAGGRYPAKRTTGETVIVEADNNEPIDLDGLRVRGRAARETDPVGVVERVDAGGDERAHRGAVVGDVAADPDVGHGAAIIDVAFERQVAALGIVRAEHAVGVHAVGARAPAAAGDAADADRAAVRADLRHAEDAPADGDRVGRRELEVLVEPQAERAALHRELADADWAERAQHREHQRKEHA